MARSGGPTINQGPGSALSFGQQGGITAGTVYIAPGRLAFSKEQGEALLAKMPTKKPVQMVSVGGNADQKVADDIEAFLKQSGYQTERMAAGTLAPPPDKPITLGETPGGYSLVIAPSAH